MFQITAALACSNLNYCTYEGKLLFTENDGINSVDFNTFKIDKLRFGPQFQEKSRRSECYLSCSSNVVILKMFDSQHVIKNFHEPLNPIFQSKEGIKKPSLEKDLTELNKAGEEIYKSKDFKVYIYQLEEIINLKKGFNHKYQIRIKKVQDDKNIVLKDILLKFYEREEVGD
jgi:hypothetical protein